MHFSDLEQNMIGRLKQAHEDIKINVVRCRRRDEKRVFKEDRILATLPFLGVVRETLWPQEICKAKHRRFGKSSPDFLFLSRAHLRAI